RHVRDADVGPGASGAPKESLRPLWLECLVPAALVGALGGLVGSDLVGDPLGLGWITTAFVFACIPVVVFFVRIWRKLTDPGERGRVGALLAIYGVVIVFWMIFHQNSTALTAWAVEHTDRTPGPLVQGIVDLRPEFAENAPPSYFDNAGPDTPRPDRSTYQVVSQETYEEEGNQLIEDGKPVLVTEAMLGKVYAGA